jgi:nucleoid-associated protein YgaU
MTDANTFTIEEVESADGGAPLRVVLKGRDAPLGGRGSGAAFEDSVQVRQNETYYPGQDTPSRQVMGVKHGPWNIKGNLQDRGVPGRAFAVAASLKQLAVRKRRLRISWGPLQVFGLADEVKISPEGARDYNYDVTLHIDGPELPSAALVVAAASDTTPDTLGRDAAAARLIALDPIDAAVGGLSASEALGIAEGRLVYLTALDALMGAVEGLSGGMALSPFESGRVEAAALTCAAVSPRFATLLTAVPPPALRGWRAAVDWQRASLDAAEGAWTASDTALSTQERLARLTRGEAESTVTVTDGDTLESIARDRLGDERRASEIARRNSLTGHRLTGGQRLTLPAR